MMRLAWAILIALIAAPFGVGQDDSQLHFVTDSAGDVGYLVAEDQEAPTTPVSDHERADLLWLDIEETTRTLKFIATVANMDQFPDGSDRWIDSARIDVRFTVGDLFYDVSTGTFDDGIPFAELRGGRTDQSDPVIQPTLPVTLEGSTFTVDVERNFLRDEQGAPVQTGMSLENLRVVTHVHATGLFLQNPDGSLFQPLGIRDRMPDDGFVSLEILKGGPENAGEILLSTSNPYRASNGGEAAIAYSYLLENQAEETHQFDVTVTGAPDSWDLEFIPRVEIEGGKTVQGSILVHTPFGHQHGGTEEFNVTITRTDGAATASATMGILYLAIPQPAGHHDTVYLHSSPTGNIPGAPTIVQAFGGRYGNLWMNTDLDDPRNEDIPIPGAGSDASFLFDATGFDWYVCLDPNLQLGLDFNAGEGLATIYLDADRDLTGTLSGELVHMIGGDAPEGCYPEAWRGRTETVVAELAESEPTNLNGAPVFELPITATAEGDFVPYAPDTDLVLFLHFEIGEPNVAGAGPRLMPGSMAKLPLDEYFDEHPAGIIHPGDEGGEAEPAHGVDEPPAKATPMPLLLLPLALFAARRRA